MSDLKWLKKEAEEIERRKRNLEVMITQHRERLMYNILNPAVSNEERRKLLEVEKLTEKE